MTGNPYNKIESDILKHTRTLPDQAGRERTVIKDQEAINIASENKVDLYVIYNTALKKKILPYRYIRNLESITIDEQLKLLESSVSVIGAGGLGGQAIILLARLGVGNLTVVDHDEFDESNLNRQAFCTIDVIGKSKAETAKETLAKINPAVNVTAFHTRLDNSNADTILTGSEVIVDALDNISDRFILENQAKKLGIPLVHGAVAGFEGQVMTIFPEDAGMESLYGKNRNTNPEKSPVSILGVPCFTPAIIASYQIIEVVKFLLDREGLFRNMLFYMDLTKGEYRKLRFRNDLT